MMNAAVSEAISIMWQGMAGIFVVMCVIYGVVVILGKIGNK